MPTRPHCFAAVSALVLATCLAAPVPGYMVPIDDLRIVSARAVLSGYGEQEFSYGPFGPFLPMDEVSVAEVYGDKAGSASATAFQISSFDPTLIYASGGTGGQYQIYPGEYQALSLSTMTFRVDTCVTWFLDATMEPGEAGSEGAITMGHAIGPELYTWTSGHDQSVGRLSPGTYFVEGRSRVQSGPPSMAGPTYGIVWQCVPCQSALIRLQPDDVLAPLGGTATFSVTPNPAPHSVSPDVVLTYQWRRNAAPLTDGGAYDGVHTPTLEITGVSPADTGWYDVVVTSGSIVEPSSIARLSISNTNDVGPGSGVSGLRFALAGAAPNPSRGATSFRYAAAQPVRATATIHDAAGRLVRDLGALELAGSGVIAWDGEGSASALAAGLYFLRVELPGESHVLRFVRLR